MKKLIFHSVVCTYLFLALACVSCTITNEEPGTGTITGGSVVDNSVTAAKQTVVSLSQKTSTQGREVQLIRMKEPSSVFKVTSLNDNNEFSFTGLPFDVYTVIIKNSENGGLYTNIALSATSSQYHIDSLVLYPVVPVTIYSNDVTVTSFTFYTETLIKEGDAYTFNAIAYPKEIGTLPEHTQYLQVSVNEGNISQKYEISLDYTSNVQNLDVLIQKSVSTSVSQKLCSELAVNRQQPATIHSIIGMGETNTGTLYLIDTQGDDKRVFISANNSLYRTGITGSSTRSEKYNFLSIDNGDQVLFKNESGVVTDLYACIQSQCDECDSILDSYRSNFSKANYDKELEQGWQSMTEYLDEERSDCQALNRTSAEKSFSDINAIMDFPPTTNITYMATHDDMYLIVSEAGYDQAKTNPVIHYGTLRDMKMRSFRGFMQSGGSTEISFMVGSQEAVAYFGNKITMEGTFPTVSYLILNGDTLTLTTAPSPEETFAKLGFNCDHEVKFY